MARTSDFTEVLVDWVDGRLRQNRFANMWLGGGPGADGGSSYRPIDGQLTQRHVCYDTSEKASPCSPSGFSSLVDNLRRIRYWQEPATWFGVITSGAPPSGSYLNVYIKPGLWYPSTTEYCAFTGGNSPTFTLPGVLDRIDTVYIDPSGILHIQRGTPAVSPTITLPPIASGIPLWAVHLTPTASGITFIECSGYYSGMGYIERDLRPFLNLGGGGAVASGVLPASNRGAILRGGVADWETYNVGAANEVLTNDGTDVIWSTGAINLTAGKTLVVSVNLTLAGVDGKSLTIEENSILNQDLTTDANVTFANVGIGVVPTTILHVRKDTADTQVIFESTEDIELVVRGDRSNDDENKHAWISCYQDGSARWLKMGVGECNDNNEGFIASYETLNIFVGTTWPATTPAVTILDTGHVGMGITPGNHHVYIYDNTLNSAATFTGLRIHHIKTAGAGAAGDDYYGVYSIMTLDQATTIDNMYGAVLQTVLTSGTIDLLIGTNTLARVASGTANEGIRGIYILADIDGGTIGGKIYGLHTVVDIEVAATCNDVIYGAYIRVDDDDNTSTSYMLYLSEGSNIDYGMYQSGSADNYFGGDVGIGVAPNFRLDVKDDAAAGFIANFFNDGDNVNRYGIRVQAGADNGAAVGSTFYFYATDGDGNVTGTLLTVNGVFQLSDASDESRKVNIRDTKIVGLDMVSGLRVRDYNWKTNPKGPVMTSFVAQEAQEVFPAMVVEALDGTLMTTRAMLIPVLTKAIQELDARLTRLEGY